MQKFSTVLVIFIVLMGIGVCYQCRTIRNNGKSQPVSHAIWDDLLHQYVTPEGWVDYQGFIRDSTRLNQYLNLIKTAHPNEKTWSRNEQLAYWINAYNAFTVQLIVRHYPVASIKDIKRGVPFVNTVWDLKFIKIEGFTYDLNNIEHNIIRPAFKDARIHAAINCASYSCPPLRAEAFTADRLDAQLTDGMRRFVSDPLRNRISAERVELSEIFKWFKGDFERDAGTVTDFINRFMPPATIGKSANVQYIDYDWRLNDAATKW
jgi:Protein of unknown function, DUF547